MSEEIKVPLEFNHDGFHFQQVERKGDLAIYTQNKFGKVIAWEVVKIRHWPARKLPSGKIRPAAEHYPAPSDWGNFAWSCASLDRARQRLQEMLQRVILDPTTHQMGQSGGQVSGENHQGNGI